MLDLKTVIYKCKLLGFQIFTCLDLESYDPDTQLNQQILNIT